VSSRIPSGSRSWRSPPSTLLRVPPMEVAGHKTPTAGTHRGAIVKIIGEFEGLQSPRSIYWNSLASAIHRLASATHRVPISSKIIVSEFKHALQHQSSRQRLVVEITMCCLGEDRAPVRDGFFFGLHCYRVRSKVELLQHAEGSDKIANAIACIESESEFVVRQHASSPNKRRLCCCANCWFLSAVEKSTL
jgi:hypothetical protein